MSFWKAYTNGFGAFWEYRKTWFWYYIFNLLVALLIAFPVYQYLNASFGQTMIPALMLEKYDFRIVTDILNQYGLGLGVLLNQSIVLSVAFVLISALLLGGILHYYIYRVDFDTGTFWQKSLSYFWKIVALAMLFLIIQLILLGIAWSLFMYFSHGMSPDNLESEHTVIRALQWVGIPYLIVLFLIAMCHDYAKVCLVSNQKGVVNCLFCGFRFGFSHLRKTLPLLILNILTFLIVYVLYKWIDFSLAENSGGQVLFFFLISQLYILIRIGVKLWNLASISTLYNGLKTERIKEELS